MQRILRHSILAVAITGASGAASAGGWDLFPVTGADYKAEPTLAVIGGAMDPDFSDADSDALYGLELSLNCPLLQTPSNRIRQQLSVTHYDEDGLEMVSVEINPHYVVPVSDGLEFGFGPGLGVIDVDSGSDSETLLGLQAGMSLHYRRDAMFVGAEARYQVTTEEEFAGVDRDADNSRYLLKAGINF